MIWKHSIPQPPVPQFLRETLKDYPEIIQDIQDVLTDAASDSSYFDWAVTRLQDTLENHYIDARVALEAAGKTGDSQAIYQAKIKHDALVEAGRKGDWIVDDALWDYYNAHQGGLG